jgi:ABC-2 type transport system ATP-binding protein
MSGASKSDWALSIRGLRKAYASGTEALKAVDLDIRHGEIFALLGPNGAGKTTLISIVCGLVTATSGEVLVDGVHWRDRYKEARRRIGLVPQEMNIDVFEPVWNTVAFSRELFGLKRDDKKIEQILRDLTLWDKRKDILKDLSGGMKRRVMIAKALAHEPDILFLDEPTAGVDVELRKEMWAMVRGLQERGTTIILTTHYIEEAEEMADRVGVINKGELILVEEKAALMQKLGRKVLHLSLAEPLVEVPPALADWSPQLSEDGLTLTYEFDRHAERTGIPSLLAALRDLGIGFKDLDTKQSSLEDIFVGLIRDGNGARA